MSNTKPLLLVEKYRPQTIEDCILPAQIKNTFKEFVENEDLPSLLLHGKAGVGKTTIAKALCNELNYEYLMINGSEDGNIDTLRTTIKQFASTVSFQGGLKVVILDEADYLNPQSTQPALRGFIEEFSDNCRFILTCNYKNKIIEPLHSRCVEVGFDIPRDEKPEIAKLFFNRLQTILQEENIEYEKKVLVSLITKYFPDFRKILMEVQRYSVSGKIDAGILANMAEQNYQQLFAMLKEKDFKNVRKWVVDNVDQDINDIVRLIYDNAKDNVEDSSIPELVLILNEYMYKHAFVADPELNVAAMMVEIMGSVEWK